MDEKVNKTSIYFYVQIIEWGRWYFQFIRPVDDQKPMISLIQFYRLSFTNIDNRPVEYPSFLDIVQQL